MGHRMSASLQCLLKLIKQIRDSPLSTLTSMQDNVLFTILDRKVIGLQHKLIGLHADNSCTFQICIYAKYAIYGIFGNFSTGLKHHAYNQYRCLSKLVLWNKLELI